MNAAKELKDFQLIPFFTLIGSITIRIPSEKNVQVTQRKWKSQVWKNLARVGIGLELSRIIFISALLDLMKFLLCFKVISSCFEAEFNKWRDEKSGINFNWNLKSVSKIKTIFCDTPGVALRFFWDSFQAFMAFKVNCVSVTSVLEND